MAWFLRQDEAARAGSHEQPPDGGAAGGGGKPNSVNQAFRRRLSPPVPPSVRPPARPPVSVTVFSMPLHDRALALPAPRGRAAADHFIVINPVGALEAVFQRAVPGKGGWEGRQL